MKKDKELKQLKKEKKKKQNYKWIILISCTAFFISFVFSFASEAILPNVNILIGLLLLFFFIGLGVFFDMVGVSVTAADIKPFNSMSSRKVKGSALAVKFIKNADKVSSFCNDVIGDICGIVSGSAGVIIATAFSSHFGWNPFLTSLIVTAFIASVTIGGKALGKSIAINKSNEILYQICKLCSPFIKVKTK